ncbi:MAG: CYTH domain-containing protein [Clostridia bacterium]|nr:CYTH domain-containing protein [Clostridia bacterium]
MEIERKFLVSSLPNLTSADSSEIEQCYISVKPEIRLRRRGDHYYITFKGEGSLSRAETEISISKNEYTELLSFATSRVIKKTRYVVPLEDGSSAECDVYGAELEGFAAVEVEFENEKDALEFKVPDWFGDELTYDDRVKNSKLAFLPENELKALVSEMKGYAL